MKVVNKLESYPTGDMIVPYCPNCNNPTYSEEKCPFCNTQLEYEEERELIGHSTEPDPDGEKHEWLQYKYKDYIFNKEWYVDMENKYSMGITIFKLGKKNKLVPSIKYKDKEYVEVFHSGHCNDLSDDETIELVELILNKYGEKNNE